MYYSNLDFNLAQYIIDLSEKTKKPNIAFLLVRLLSYQIGAGNVCLNLDALPSLEEWPLHKKEKKDSQSTKASASKIYSPQKEKQLIQNSQTIKWLEESDIVCQAHHKKARPLYWEKPRLYLYRHYYYERQVAQYFSQKRKDKEIHLEKIHDFLLQKDYKFMGEQQKLALWMAMLRPFLIISGGPGTGKTTTLAKIIEAKLAMEPSLKIALSAPTGKATKRMQEILLSQKIAVNKLSIQTIHRLLKQTRDGSHYGHHSKNPLVLDTLVIDEASMLDLSLMYHTLEALGEETQLILIGDPQQLSSVEAGSILSELSSLYSHLSPSFAKKLQPFFSQTLETQKEGNLLENTYLRLKQNFRFSETSGIAKFAQVIDQGTEIAEEKNKKEVLSKIYQGKFTDINYYENDSYSETFFSLVENSFRHCFDHIESPEKILAALQKLAILTPFRHGRYGTLTLNQKIQKYLVKKNIFPKTKNQLGYYPILINNNNYNLSLYTGDHGLVYPFQDTTMVCFREEDKKTRHLPLALLPSYEKAFAMTIHRSQGSEFEHVILILPDTKENIFLNRELIYTACTRAKKKLSIFTKKDVLETAIEKKASRQSTLGERISRFRA